MCHFSQSVLLQCQAALDNLSQLIRCQSCLQKPVSFNPHAAGYLLNDIIWDPIKVIKHLAYFLSMSIAHQKAGTYMEAHLKC